jgi:hypothetical protein
VADTCLTAAPPCRSRAAFPDAGLPDERSSDVRKRSTQR